MNTKRKKRRAKYFAVNLWQKEFSRISEIAVFQIFESKFNIPNHEMKNYSFPHCVESLRFLEDETYKPRGKITRLIT